MLIKFLAITVDIIPGNNHDKTFHYLYSHNHTLIFWYILGKPITPVELRIAVILPVAKTVLNILI